MKKLLLGGIALLALTACDYRGQQTASAVETKKQEQSLEEMARQVGMPAIINFQEKRMVKQIYELRDQQISTQAYIVNSMRGCLVYLGQAVGYGLPYATQYTSPHKPWVQPTTTSSVITDEINAHSHGDDQPEPNGLFMPSAAEGTWVMLKNPEGTDVRPVYIEPQVIVSPFRLTSQECK